MDVDNTYFFKKGIYFFCLIFYCCDNKIDYEKIDYEKPLFSSIEVINSIEYNFIQLNLGDSLAGFDVNLNMYYRTSNDSVFFLNKKFVDYLCYDEALVAIIGGDPISIDNSECEPINSYNNPFYISEEVLSSTSSYSEDYYLIQHGLYELLKSSHEDYLPIQQRFFLFNKKEKKIFYFKDILYRELELKQYFNY